MTSTADPHSKSASYSPRRPAFRDWADSISKLAAAGAIVWGAWIANSYQGKATAVELLSEREQAETALRASMFSDLIKPLVGEKVDEVTIEAEQLLTELLALNFHEHFQFKPLLLHIDQRLRREQPTAWAQSVARLQSIMRRVRDRQINTMMSATRRASENRGKAKASKKLFQLSEKIESETTESDQTKNQCSEKYPSNSLVMHCQNFNTVIFTHSPDMRYRLGFTVTKPQFDEQTFTIDAFLTPGPENNDVSNPVDLKADFQLTWYDLPFTDHMLLADGTRFAFFIDEVFKCDGPANLCDGSNDQNQNEVRIGLMWFPNEFFLPTERPVSHSDFRQLLGFEVGDP